MRLVRASLTAVGAALMPMNYHSTYIAQNTMYYGTTSITGTNTAQLDGTISDLGNNIAVTLSRSGTTVTVTFPTLSPHTLGGTSDYVRISGSGVASLDGFFSLAGVTSETVLTYTSGTSATTTAKAIACPIRFHAAILASGAVSATVPTLVAPSAIGAYLEQSPYTAMILKVTAYGGAGTIISDVLQCGIV